MKAGPVREAGAGVGVLRAVSARGLAGRFAARGALVSRVYTTGIALARS